MQKNEPALKNSYFSGISWQISSQNKQKRVLDLLCAQINLKSISDIFGLDLCTVCNIKRATDMGNGTQRKPCSFKVNMKNKEFISIKTKIMSDPTASMYKLLKVQSKRVGHDVLKSYVRT